MRHCGHRGGWLVGILLIAALGCSQSTQQRKVVPVRGQVFWQSKPAAGALVVLCPDGAAAAEEWPEGYPRGSAGEDGSFRMGTYDKEDGAPEGQYKVTITWETPAPNAERTDGEALTVDRLAGKYADPTASAFAVTIAAPETELPRLDLK